jgi:pilus assembly protein CpaB
VALTTVSPARALRQPRRLDLRAVVGVILLLGATGGSIAFWTASADTRAVVVATRDLPAGSTLTATDLAVTRVRVDDAIYQVTIPADALVTLVGKPLAEPMHARQLLVSQQIAARPPLAPEQVAFTLPVGPEVVAGGHLRPGDLVEVLVTTDKGKPDSQTTVVLNSATVYDVSYAEKLAVVSTAAASDADASGRPAARGAISAVTLAVTRWQAQQLAHAKWNGELDLALLPPQRP